MTVNLESAAKSIKTLLTQPNTEIVPGLVGLTGIGKTWLVKEIAEELDFNLVKFNASQLQEGDLALPFKSNEDVVKRAVDDRLKYVLDHPEVKSLIFFDEANRASIGVINEMMTMLNEGEIAGYKFPEETRFVVAMNPTAQMEGFENTEYAVSDMDDAHYNRFVLINVEASPEIWLNWGKDILHPSILSFFKNFDNQTKCFYGKDTNGGVQIATPRAWHHISDLMKYMDSKKESFQQEYFVEIVAGQVGMTKAMFFLNWIKENIKPINVKDILTGEPLSDVVLESFRSAPSTQQRSVFLNAAKAFSYKTRIKNKKLINSVNAENMYALFNSIEHVDLKSNIILEIVDLNLLFDIFDGSADEATIDPKETKEFKEYIESISSIFLHV